MNLNTNLLIKGENLDGLKILLKSHKEKIQLVCTDPPYNTDISHIGYKDQNYPLGWSEFMRPRLEIAYELLSATGVMFICIDENELCNLLCLTGKIFGAKNVRTIVWKKTNKNFDKNRIEKPLENGIRRTNEFIVLAFKDAETIQLNPIYVPNPEKNYTCDNLKPMETILDNLGTTTSAKEELQELFKTKDIFSTPKPLKLFKELIRAGSDKNSIILDFFAGSATSGDAIMHLNREDGGKRKFILMNNNENNIFENVTKARIDKSIEKNNFQENYQLIDLSST